MRVERNPHSLLLKEKYQEFNEDSFILHSGTEIHEGKIIQVINGDTNKDGKHTSAYLDFGAPIGQLYKSFGHMYPEVQLGTHSLIMIKAVPATVQNDLNKNLPNAATRGSVLERIEDGTNIGMTSEEYSQNLNFSEEFLNTNCAFITHSHPDHVGNVALLDDQIKIVSSPQTHLLQKLEQKINPKNWMNDRVEYKVYEEGIPTKEKRTRNYVVLNEGEDYRIGNEKGYLASLLPVTHWPGSRAVEIMFPSGKRTLFTGDINSGLNTDILKDHLRNTPKIDLMILDATHVLSRNLNGVTESELEQEFILRFTNSGPFYIAINEKDLIRLQSIVNAVQANDKNLYIPLSVAYYLKNLRDKLGNENRELPDISSMQIYLQPIKSGQYITEDYSPIYRNIINDKSLNIITQEELHHSTQKSKKGVIIFTHPQQITKFSSRNLFGRGKRLIMSTFGNNPDNEFNFSRWSSINRNLNTNNMSMETLNALHHMGISEFEDFIKNDVDAEKVLVIPSRDPKLLKEFIESKTLNKLKVIDNLKYGQPYNLNGQMLTKKAVSYP